MTMINLENYMKETAFFGGFFESDPELRSMLKKLQSLKSKRKSTIQEIDAEILDIKNKINKRKSDLKKDGK